MDVKHWFPRRAVDQILYFVDLAELDVTIDEQCSVVLVAEDVSGSCSRLHQLFEVLDEVRQVLQLHVSLDDVAGIQEANGVDVSVQG